MDLKEHNQMDDNTIEIGDNGINVEEIMERSETIYTSDRQQVNCLHIRILQTKPVHRIALLLNWRIQSGK